MGGSALCARPARPSPARPDPTATSRAKVSGAAEQAGAGVGAVGEPAAAGAGRGSPEERQGCPSVGPAAGYAEGETELLEQGSATFAGPASRAAPSPLPGGG